MTQCPKTPMMVSCHQLQQQTEQGTNELVMPLSPPPPNPRTHRHTYTHRETLLPFRAEKPCGRCTLPCLVTAGGRRQTVKISVVTYDATKTESALSGVHSYSLPGPPVQDLPSLFPLLCTQHRKSKQTQN